MVKVSRLPSAREANGAIFQGAASSRARDMGADFHLGPSFSAIFFKIWNLRSWCLANFKEMVWSGSPCLIGQNGFWSNLYIIYLWTHARAFFLLIILLDVVPSQQRGLSFPSLSTLTPFYWAHEGWNEGEGKKKGNMWISSFQRCCVSSGHRNFRGKLNLTRVIWRLSSLEFFSSPSIPSSPTPASSRAPELRRSPSMPAPGGGGRAGRRVGVSAWKGRSWR